MAFPIILDDSLDRNEVMADMEAAGVECRPLFGCIPTRQGAFHYLDDSYTGCVPNAEYLGDHGIYVGCHQYMTEEDVETVAKTIKEVCSG